MVLCLATVQNIIEQEEVNEVKALLVILFFHPVQVALNRTTFVGLHYICFSDKETCFFTSKIGKQYALMNTSTFAFFL